MLELSPNKVHLKCANRTLIILTLHHTIMHVEQWSTCYLQNNFNNKIIQLDRFKIFYCLYSIIQNKKKEFQRRLEFSCSLLSELKQLVPVLICRLFYEVFIFRIVYNTHYIYCVFFRLILRLLEGRGAKVKPTNRVSFYLHISF